jgi:hypothetical protein
MGFSVAVIAVLVLALVLQLVPHMFYAGVSLYVSDWDTAREGSRIGRRRRSWAAAAKRIAYRGNRGS